MTSEHATFILSNVALPSLNAEHPVTKRVIAAIAADKADYRPDDIIKSAIDLAWHIVTAETVLRHHPRSGSIVITLTPTTLCRRAPAGPKGPALHL
jgi:hypothetical protein